MTDLPFSKNAQVGDRRLALARQEMTAKLATLPKPKVPLQNISAFVEAVWQENAHQSKHAWIEIGGQRYYMKSKWERNYARYLQWLKDNKEIRRWEYEPRRFDFPIKRGSNSYLPDFRVTEKDSQQYWIEIKGYMAQKDRVKLRRFMKYFPEEKIMLIDQDQYRKLSRELKNLIPGWEK